MKRERRRSAVSPYSISYWGHNMRVRVVTDSSTSVPDDYLARLGIAEALATVNFGHESYLNKVDLSLEEFYRRLVTTEKLPTTSQPTPKQFAGAYARLASEGAEEIIAVCVSDRLSGTLNSAVIAAEQAPVPVHIWDTQHISMAAGWQAIAAGEMARDGLDRGLILDRLDGIRSRTHMAFAPADLRYLVASGRVPRLRGAVGDLLSIKPILTTEGGLLEPLIQVRGHRKALDEMLSRMAAAWGDRPVRVAVGHCNIPEEAVRYLEVIRARLHVVEAVLFDLGVVFATLGGPGLIGLGGYALED
jgi:DegV family protein with EDD domain